MKTNPFELAYRYVFPSIRRHLVEILYREYNLNQLKIAESLGLTQSAISRYVDRVRGTAFDVTKYNDLNRELRDLAVKIVNGKTNVYEVQYELTRITVTALRNGYVCGLHEVIDDEIDPSKCGICLRVFK
jgi:hypothetical protein